MAESSTLYLSNHAFVCLTETHCVFLDLRRDTYLCASRDAASTLEKHVANWNDSVPNARNSPPTTHDEGFVRKLLDAQILTPTFERSHAQSYSVPTVPIPAAHTLHDNSRYPLGRLTILDWMRFAAATTRAHFDLTNRQLETTVNAVANRKQERSINKTIDRVRLNDLAKRFRTLRYCFPRSYLCLFDSLALVHFLSFYGIYPSWVFGVTTEPFSAHCWVQVNEVIVNDPLDRVSFFTPIMII